MQSSKVVLGCAMHKSGFALKSRWVELDTSTRCHMVGDLNQMRRPGGDVLGINVSKMVTKPKLEGDQYMHSQHNTIAHCVTLHNSSRLIASRELIISLLNICQSSQL